MISFVFLCVGWYGIYLATLYEDVIQDWSLDVTGNGFIGEWLAAVVMSFVNYLIPWVIDKISFLEKWDFSEEILYN